MHRLAFRLCIDCFGVRYLAIPHALHTLLITLTMLRSNTPQTTRDCNSHCKHTALNRIAPYGTDYGTIQHHLALCHIGKEAVALGTVPAQITPIYTNKDLVSS